MEKEIQEKLKQILGFEFKKLYPTSSGLQLWNNLENEKIKPFIDSIKENFTVLDENIKLLEQVPPTQLPNLNNQLQEFINNYTNNLQNIEENTIASQHHGPLNNLISIYDQLRNLGLLSAIESTKLLKKKAPDITLAGEVAKELLDSKVDIKESIQRAKDWLEVRNDVYGKAIDEQAEAFHDMASSHKAFRGWTSSKEKGGGWIKKSWRWTKNSFLSFRGSWIWILLTFAFAGATAFVTFFFIVKASSAESSVGIGEALLRITSLIVPAYLTLFCANQFIYHKRLYDNYMFKYSALNTMNSLIATHKELGNEILSKGLDVLFSEPKVKEGTGKYDTHLVTELIKMLRDQK